MVWQVFGNQPPPKAMAGKVGNQPPPKATADKVGKR
jgi:hypothetical protein